MMDGFEANKLVKGALLLTIAGFISKILSAGYRIPLQNLTGDFGYYVYQQIYPILGIVIILSLYGFPSAVSKITADLKAEENYLSFKTFYWPVFLILLGINSLLFIILFLNANAFARLVGDVHLQGAYRLTSFTFLLIPFTSLLRGVFQGNYYMKPTAYSQVGEQIFRVFIIILSAYLFVNKKIDVYTIGKAGALASILGATIAIMILVVFLKFINPVRHDSIAVPWGYYIRTIISLGIVASLNHMVLLIIQFADVFTLVPSLLKYGLSSIDAMKAKGVFDRGQPLIQLGTVLGSSFALAIIPSVSKNRLKKEPKTFYQNIQRALAVSFYISAAAVIGLVLILPETNLLLFKNLNGTFSLQILSIVIFLSAITITITSILQGLGYLRQIAIFIMITFFIKWILNQLLVPYWGITGSAFATVMSMMILSCLVLVQLKRALPNFKIFRVIKWKSFLMASFGMIVYINIFHSILPYTYTSSRLTLLVYVCFIALSGALIYILLLLKFNTFTERELSMFPFASFLIRIYKGRDSVESQN